MNNVAQKIKVARYKRCAKVCDFLVVILFMVIVGCQRQSAMSVKEERSRALVDQLTLELAHYYDEHGHFPETLDELGLTNLPAGVKDIDIRQFAYSISVVSNKQQQSEGYTLENTEYSQLLSDVLDEEELEVGEHPSRTNLTNTIPSNTATE